MTSKKRSLIVGLTLSITMIAIFNHDTGMARGGFRGGGAGSFDRGGFDRGGFSRSNFDRAFDHYGSDVGDIHGFDNAHPAAAEDRTYNWGNHGLSTDNGLAKTDAAMTPSYSGHVTPAQFANHADAVRDAYRYPGVFDSGWWGAHPNAWRYDTWRYNNWAWGTTSWPVIAGWWGMPIDVAPIPYDYGNNITYQNNSVYYGSQPLESSVAYYEQAQTLAGSQPVLPPQKNQSSSKEWKPLGVYSLVQGGQSNTNMMFQLAVNKEGAIKGNYYNALTDETKPVTGAVDKKNMRAAWTVGENRNVVYDSGLSNLLKEQSPVLVHMGKDKTQQWTLVKLQQPKKET
jgi:hypothetical protein